MYATFGNAPTSTCVWVSRNNAWTATAGSCHCCRWRRENTSCSSPRIWPSTGLACTLTNNNLRAHIICQVPSFFSFRSYYESNDLTAALGIIEEALDRHPELVSDDFVNMAAELNIASHHYNKALQVHVHVCDQCSGHE